MNILIIEDELPARQRLVKLINKYFPDFNICAELDSCESAIDYLKKNTPDLIFMDVELSDGKCFEIFENIEISVPVIITTAYEAYALEAFKVKCIDYLLKPVDRLEFKESVERCLSLCHPESSSDQIINNISRYTMRHYKHHFTIKLGSQILLLDVNDIAYFYSNEKYTYVVTKDGNEYMADDSLVSIEEEVDPAIFYKISRKCLASIGTIYTISKYFNSRLKVTLSPKKTDPIIVSRDRVQNFLNWLEGNV